MTTLTPHPAARHSAEQIDATLVVIALESGNIGRARKKLAETKLFDKVPPASTIGRWPETYRDRYVEIREEVAPRLKARMADTHTDLAERLAALEHATIDELESEMAELSGKDKAALLRNVSIAGAVHIDKAQLLRNEPTAIVKRELPEIFRALAAKGVMVEGVIEGEAEEVSPPPPALETSKATPEESPTPRKSQPSSSPQT